MARRPESFLGAQRGSKAPGRTLGEEQAFIDGKARGRQETLLALAGAFKKVLDPDSMTSLSRALIEGLAANQPATRPGSDGPDCTEPEPEPERRPPHYATPIPKCPQCGFNRHVVLVADASHDEAPRDVWRCCECDRVWTP